MDSIINFQILRHPMNWFIVTMMILIIGIAIHFLLTFYTGQPKPQSS